MSKARNVENKGNLVTAASDPAVVEKEKRWYAPIRRFGRTIAGWFGKGEEEDDDGSASGTPYRDIAESLPETQQQEHDNSLLATNHESPLGKNVDPTLAQIVAAGMDGVEPSFVATIEKGIIPFNKYKVEKALAEPVVSKAPVKETTQSPDRTPEPDPGPAPQNRPTTPRFTR